MDERKTPRAAREPRLELVELLWTMRAPRGRLLECAIFRTAAGLEVRVGYDGDLLRSEFVTDVGVGREVAEQWRQQALSKGFQVIVPLTKH